MPKDHFKHELPCDPRSVPAIILAGGQSQRLRINHHYKWQLPFANNKTLLHYIINKISKQSEHVIINSPYINLEKNGTHTNSSIHNDLSAYSLPIVNDVLPGFQGPLAGLLSCLLWAKKQGHPWVMTLACDTPFFPDNLLSQLFIQAQTPNKNNAYNNNLAITVSSNERIHPIFGLWSTELLAPLQQHIQTKPHEKRLLSISLWAKKHASIVKIETTENKNYDPFFNINTPDDYQKALAIIIDNKKSI